MAVSVSVSAFGERRAGLALGLDGTGGARLRDLRSRGGAPGEPGAGAGRARRAPGQGAPAPGPPGDAAGGGAMSGLAGARALVTAGASGIGRAMAAALSAAGARVWVTDLDAEALADTPADWQRCPTDAADEAGTGALFEEIAAVWGGLDILCANAGVAGPTAPVEAVSLEAWRACTAVNLDGAFLAAKHAATMMKAQGSGAMVFTTSTAGLFGYPNRAPYCAAKWGVIGLMKTCAMELGPHGVRANAIAPGAVEGPRMEGVLARQAALLGTTRDALYAGYASGASMRCWVTPEDVAAMAVFLASPAAARISGQVIAVDGHTENPDPKV